MFHVIPRKIVCAGKDIEIFLLRKNGEDGILQKSLSMVIGMDDAKLSRLLRRNGLRRIALNGMEIAFLCQLGMIKPHTLMGNFIPQKTVLALTKIIHSDQTRNLYAQAWIDNEWTGYYPLRRASFVPLAAENYRPWVVYLPSVFV